MRHLIIIIICIQAGLTIKGQQKNLILTPEQNTLWFDSLSLLPPEYKLAAISRRLLADTIIYTRTFYNDRIKVKEQPGNRLNGDSKPVIIINTRHAIVINNETVSAKIIALSQLITAKYITGVSLLNNNNPLALSLYGKDGRGGVIFLELTKKKFLKKFKLLKI